MEIESTNARDAEIIDIFTARHRIANKVTKIVLTGPSQKEPPEGYFYRGTTPQGVSMWEFGGPQLSLPVAEPIE